MLAEKEFKEVTRKIMPLSRGGEVFIRHYSSTEEDFFLISLTLLCKHKKMGSFKNKIESLVPAKQILLELLNRYQIEMLDSSNCLT